MMPVRVETALPGPCVTNPVRRLLRRTRLVMQEHAAPASRRRYEMARLQVAVVIPCARSMFAGSALRLCVQHVPALRARRRRNRRVDFFDLSRSSISAECLCKKVRTRMEHHSG